MSNRKKKARAKRFKYEKRHSIKCEKTHEKLKGGFDLWRIRKRS